MIGIAIGNCKCIELSLAIKALDVSFRVDAALRLQQITRKALGGMPKRPHSNALPRGQGCTA